MISYGKLFHDVSLVTKLAADFSYTYELSARRSSKIDKQKHKTKTLSVCSCMSVCKI